MSLYDGLGIDSGKEKEKGELAGWSSGIKLLQSQLQLKKAALTQVKKEQLRKGTTLPPVVDLKSRKEENEELPMTLSSIFNDNRENKTPNTNNCLFGPDPEWNLRDEYDPMWPNDYEKIIKEKREKKEKEREEDRRRDYEERERRRRERYNRDTRDRDDDNVRDRRRRDDDNEDEGRPRRGRKYKDNDYQDSKGIAGAAIAPPPSLMAEDERKEPIQPSNFTGAGFAPSLGGSVAAKIMAKYGFKEGQGLGKQEQGMSQALQVEKTSKRGGKIIHERDIPKVEEAESSDEDEGTEAEPQVESITEAMKNPSKVVLLRNMVGPGEVDEELEPEVKEECAKYGEVLKCVIFELSGGTSEEEAVRIFVEFKRIESAIKAVVDLNGRFFGGRVVRGGFYNLDKFRRLELAE